MSQTINDHESMRSEVVEYLVRDMFGPFGGETECLKTDANETPLQRYSTGILFPGQVEYSPEDDDGGSEGVFGSADEAEGGFALSNASKPSCYGMSFSCPPGAKSFLLRVSCAAYVVDGKVEGQTLWKRVPHQFEKEVEIRRIEETSGPMLVCRRLEVYVKFRAPDSDGNCSITVYLINRNYPGQDEDDPVIRNEARFSRQEQAKCSFFQLKFAVEGLKDDVPFVERPAANLSKLDEEQQGFQLLYRHRRGYAVGHGCSVEWEERGEGQASSVSSSFIPSYDIYPLVPPLDLELPDFSLKEIASASLEHLQELFSSVLDKYGDWINAARNEKLPELEGSDFYGVAEKQFLACESSLERIDKGIKALGNPDIFRAFRLAHEAMLIVFAHGKWKKDGYAGQPDYDGDLKWYPFQIAFILQCLESTGDSESDDRDVADLLWFPTGGGKTEAYLGLTAFVFFLRRIRAPRSGGDGGGTCAIMRYTLRLLTADQFARAALMTCACEKIRREHPDLGQTAEITIGLWVGGGVTANSTGQSSGYKACADAQRRGQRLPDGGVDPVIVTSCPFCGTSLDINEYDPQIPRLRCRSADCEFHEQLPLRFVDDDIYDSRPSLVLGTVDKFARVPWVEHAGNLFGADGASTPPELIIQDELHLISGPLGTMTGLYETAIDLLCRKDGVMPKVVASTATIRNAVSQVKGLFDRRFSQFPPPLLDARDSFFAKEDRTRPSRKYVGLFNPGTTGTTAFIKSTGCLLHAPHMLEANPSTKNPYWTFLGYFNSLRELGGARVQIMDDVNAYLKTCAARDGMECQRVIDDVRELTSRRSSSELRDARNDLWIDHPDEDCLDAVIATNMISVGLDVPRLGLMTVVGQPKTTAEFIQATSRVGRKFPGLVVTLYNPMRSRDRSHYERFVHYHSRLYAEVEATSVTPWSVRARDRALHAAFIAVVRHLCRPFSGRTKANDFSRTTEVEQIVRDILARADSVDQFEGQLTAEMLNRIIARWESLAQSGELSYDNHFDWNKSLMVPFEEPGTYRGFRTMSSVRNVDSTANLYIIQQ